jgi:hypothetical protein
VDHERRAQLAESYGRVPVGSRLIVKTVSPEELLIELIRDGPSTITGSRPCGTE